MPEAARPTPYAATIIIASRDRKEDLLAALASIATQDGAPGPCEVIVADDGSRDGTGAALAAAGALAASAEPPPPTPRPTVRLLELPVSRGPGVARNLAARYARGDVLVFLDSDCVAEPRWLAELLAPLGDPDVGLVGGAELPDPAGGALGDALHFALTSTITTGGVRGRAGRTAARYRPRTYSLAIRRSLFEELGGFRGFRHGEDLDLALRAGDRGARAAFAPASRVIHRRRATLRAFARQALAMGRARATLCRLDRRHREPLFLLPALALVVGAALAVTAPVSHTAAWLLAGGLTSASLYGGAVVAVATAQLGLRRGSLAGLAFALHVSAYATGTIVGVVHPFREEAPCSAP